MKIEVNKQYNIVRPFVLNDLPDLVVITGENGSGKTQLLNYIAASATGGVINEELGMINYPEPEFSETGELIPSLVVSDNEKQITSIEYQSAQTPRIELGKYFNINSILEEGEALIPKFLFFSFHRDEILKNEKNIQQIEADYHKFLKFKKSSSEYHNREITFPHFSQKDLNSIKCIYEKHGEADPYLLPYYYIAYLPVPNSGLFSANMKFLYMQYWARRKAKLEIGIAPWESINQVANAAGFRYILDTPNLEEEKFDILLKDKETGTVIDADSLSSGEKVIFSLILAMYTSSDQHHPDLILFDEPDAYLHPTLSKKMLDAIQNVFVKQYGIKVILTTHSPSTVAIAPEESIYAICRENGILEKSSKNKAIQVLTAGISSLSIYYDKVYQVFVEADNDNNYLSQVFTIACDRGILNPEIHLNFVNLDQDNDGGCAKVNRVVSLLTEAGNHSVYGVIDWDGKNNGNERIVILGGGSRYAVDNYILDPLAVSLLFLLESEEKLKIGFDQKDSIVSVKNKTTEELQQVMDKILTKIHEHLKEPVEASEDLVNYKTLDGQTFYLPKWFVQNKGHKIREAYQLAFPFLKKYGSEKGLYNKIINVCYLNYCEFIPNDIICTLKELQKDPKDR